MSYYERIDVKTLGLSCVPKIVIMTIECIVVNTLTPFESAFLPQNIILNLLAP